MNRLLKNISPWPCAMSAEARKYPTTIADNPPWMENPRCRAAQTEMFILLIAGLLLAIFRHGREYQVKKAFSSTYDGRADLAVALFDPLFDHHRIEAAWPIDAGWTSCRNRIVCLRLCNPVAHLRTYALYPQRAPFFVHRRLASGGLGFRAQPFLRIAVHGLCLALPG